MHFSISVLSQAHGLDDFGFVWISYNITAGWVTLKDMGNQLLSSHCKPKLLQTVIIFVVVYSIFWGQTPCILRLSISSITLWVLLVRVLRRVNVNDLSWFNVENLFEI